MRLQIIVPEYEARVRLVEKAFPLEVYGGGPPDREELELEIWLAALQEPAAVFKPFGADWPTTTLPAFDAAWCAFQQGEAIGRDFDLRIRRAFFAGGTLIFIAATLLLLQLWKLRGGEAPPSLKFYITGIFYLLLGIIIGTGLFLNWSEALRIKVPLEVHIHANSWGFMSLVFAGLLVDFVPMITRLPLGSKKDVSLIYWGMTLGAFGLVLGPWLGGSMPPTVSGLILHLAATIWLLILMVRAFKASGRLNSAGAWHLVASYLWILAPVLVAPLILLHVFESGPIESTAPQALIYGWVLQFGIALIPYIARRFFLKEENPALGGCWGSLMAATLGSIFVWVSIFIVPAREVLYGIGFALYALALIHPVRELVQIVRAGLQKVDLV